MIKIQNGRQNAVILLIKDTFLKKLLLPIHLFIGLQGQGLQI